MKQKSLLLVVALAACGGATESGLFGGGGGGDDAGSADAAGNHDAGDASSADASPGDDASTSPDANARDAAPLPDAAARDAAVDTGAIDPGIYCGKNGNQNVYCTVGQDDCCATVQNGQPPNYQCKSIQSLSCQGLMIGCDDTADCHGEICCGTIDAQTQRYREVACKTSCDNPGPNNSTQYHLCDPMLAPSDCPQGTTCQASTLLPGFYICR